MDKPSTNSAVPANSHLSGDPSNYDQLNYKYKLLVENAPVCIFEIDINKRILSVNQAGLLMLGFERIDDIFHKDFFEVFLPDNQSQVISFIRSGFHGKSSEFEIVSVNQNHERLFYACSFVPIRDENNQVVKLMGIFQDITQRRQTEELHKGSSEVLERLASGAVIEEVLGNLVSVAESLCPNMICSVLVLDHDKKHLIHVAANRLPTFYVEAINGIRVGPGVGSCGTAASTGERVIVKDVMTHPYWEPFKEMAKKADLRACWSEPIFSSLGEILGTLAMYFPDTREPNEEEMKLMTTFAHLAGIAIERKMTEEILVHQAEKQEAFYQRLDAANAALKHLASVDTLTGLLNRRGLQDVLAGIITQYNRYEGHGRAFMLDLDNFKTINDKLGYVTGDHVLKEVGERIKSCLRSKDSVARIGGDEFVVVMPNIREAESIVLAQKIRLQIGRMNVGLSTGKVVKVTASIGVVPLTEETRTLDELLAKGYSALRKSKRRGKNIVSWSHINKTEKKNYDYIFSDTLNTLRLGHRFYVVRQPIMRLENRTRVGYELLSRLKHGEFDMPEDFFHIALEAKILTFVDQSCLKKCLSMASYCEEGMQIHVNLFPSTIIETPVQRLLEEFQNVDESMKVYLEISEQQIIGNPSNIMKTIQVLKKAGVGIAMDDVGFGSSCLESLILLEPDVIKIDRSCISGVTGNKNKFQALERLLRVIDSCNAEAVAEGIETEEDLKTLVDMGIRYGQGYLLGKPGALGPADGDNCVQQHAG